MAHTHTYTHIHTHLWYSHDGVHVALILLSGLDHLRRHWRLWIEWTLHVDGLNGHSMSMD